MNIYKSMKKENLRTLIRQVIKEYNTFGETYDPEMERFEIWIKKAHPGLSKNELAYDIAFDAFQAGYKQAEYDRAELDAGEDL